jgi:hypothetical protein
VRLVFGPDVDHARLAAGIEMSQFLQYDLPLAPNRLALMNFVTSGLS